MGAEAAAVRQRAGHRVGCAARRSMPTVGTCMASATVPPPPTGPRAQSSSSSSEVMLQPERASASAVSAPSCTEADRSRRRGCCSTFMVVTDPRHRVAPGPGPVMRWEPPRCGPAAAGARSHRRALRSASCSVPSSLPPPGHPRSSGSSRRPRSPGTSSAGSSPAPAPTTRCARPANSSPTASPSPSTTSARTPSPPSRPPPPGTSTSRCCGALAAAGLTPAAEVSVKLSALGQTLRRAAGVRQRAGDLRGGRRGRHHGHPGHGGPHHHRLDPGHAGQAAQGLPVDRRGAPGVPAADRVGLPGAGRRRLPGPAVQGRVRGAGVGGLPVGARGGQVLRALPERPDVRRRATRCWPPTTRA